MLRDSAVHDRYRGWVLSPLSDRLHRLGFGSAALSAFALLTAGAGSVAFVFEPAIGGALYLFSGVLDTLDGAVSRRARAASRAGAFLDSVLDRYAEFLILLGVLGFYVHAGRLTAALVLVLLLAAHGSWMVSYTQSRAEGLGSDCSFGWFERPERVLILAFGAIASGWVDVRVLLPDFLAVRPVLGLSLAALAVGANATSLTRLRSGYRELRRDDEPSRLIDRMTGYLEEKFPSHEVSWEWEAARRVIVFRLVSGGKTMLLELSDDVLGQVGASALIQRMARWDLPPRLREHLRVLVSPSGWEPLPWRQLSPRATATSTDEEVLETFPASDATSPSSIS